MNSDSKEQKIEQLSSIGEKVLGQISSGQIKMRPRMIFVFKIIAIISAIFLAAIFVIFLISFIIFSLRSSGLWFLPGFGFRGWGIFFSSLPWLLIFITAVSIVILELLIRRFSFSYRRPLIYSILGVVILVSLSGLVIAKTHWHADIFWRAQAGRLPMAGEFYREFGAPKLDSVYHGLVVTTIDDNFILETSRGENLKIIVASSTRFSLDKNRGIIKKNDQVVIMGRRDDDSIKAFNIRRIDKLVEPFDRQPSPRPMMMRGR